jgi:membrane peptidoglycan carboxypeptidase
MATTQGGFRMPREPLYPLLFAIVIALGAALVALVLLPLFGAATMSVDRVEGRLKEAGVGRVRIPRFPERSTIYGADGSVIARIHLDEDRDVVRLRNIAPVAVDAVLAIEDDRFYQHGALDIPSVFRAVVANLIAGEITQGGSTITQQLVKNVLIDAPQQTFARKFQEAALAIRLERRYSKDEILEMYLNEVYLGNGIYGLGTAARYYFGEPASALTLPGRRRRTTRSGIRTRRSGDGTSCSAGCSRSGGSGRSGASVRCSHRSSSRRPRARPRRGHVRFSSR